MPTRSDGRAATHHPFARTVPTRRHRNSARASTPFARSTGSLRHPPTTHWSRTSSSSLPRYVPTPLPAASVLARSTAPATRRAPLGCRTNSEAPQGHCPSPHPGGLRSPRDKQRCLSGASPHAGFHARSSPKRSRQARNYQLAATSASDTFLVAIQGRNSMSLIGYARVSTMETRQYLHRHRASRICSGTDSSRRAFPPAKSRVRGWSQRTTPSSGCPRRRATPRTPVDERSSHHRSPGRRPAYPSSG